MNFKKYHVSRNLFDLASWIIANGSTYTKDGESYTFDTKQSMFSTPFYFSNTDINVSISGIIESITAPNPRLHLLHADGTNAKSGALTPTTLKSENISCAGLKLDWSSTGGEVKISNLMLNTGSQPLPYEPYSSEVWHDTPHYIHNTSTDTLTTLPAVLYPTTTTATVGLKGQAVQSGTLTPDNPIMPEGCGERTGNLSDTLMGGVSSIDGSDEAYNQRYSQIRSQYIPCTQGTNYTISSTQYPVQNYVAFYDANKNYLSRTAGEPLTQARIFTTPANAAYMRATFTHVADGQLYPYSDGVRIMLNLGSTHLPYEPFGVKIPISSAGQTTPIYLGEVPTTRKIKKLAFNGTEDLKKDTDSSAGARYYYRVPEIAYKGLNFLYVLCTHYTVDESFTLNTCRLYLGTRTNIYITVDKNDYPTIEDYQAYLAQQYAAGTPVTVWYVLATEETAVINEPLMRIGDYADTLSNVSIPVTAGGDTLSVGTTVQPSEVTVNYKGWHPVADVHEYDYLLASNPLCGIDTYKDELNLATGACTRKTKKLVLTGEESFVNAGGNAPYRLPINDIAISSSTSSIEWCCSHYQPVSTDDSWTSYDYCISRASTTAQSLQFRDATKGDIMTFKQYLAAQYAAGTPVTVWYVLASPTTETITVPSGLSGTEEGYLNQSDTPTPSNPIYPTANEVKVWK